MARYIFEGNTEDREYHRLQLLEVAHDPTTIALLQRTRIQTGWSCLELGPGAGSIFQWLGSQVGAEGSVYGVDKNAKYLQQCSSPPFSIREGHFLDVDIENLFDLVHARYVLIHNHQNIEMLGKIHALLKPGGIAVLEEPDFTSSQLVTMRHDPSHTRVNEAMCKMFKDLGLDPAYALHLPQKLENVGFQNVETQANIHLCPGNSPIPSVMAESAQVLSKEYCGTGACTEQDIQTYVTNAHTPDIWAVYHSTVSVIVKRTR